MSRKYAKGRHAVAECQRSGQKMRYRDLVEDGHIPGLLVHPDWWEPKHPQETPVRVDDPVALYRPAPEISIPTGYANPELTGGVRCLPEPDTVNFSPAALVNNALSGGETHVLTDVAVTYEIGQCIYIELDGGDWFVSKSVMERPSPGFTIEFLSAFVGAAAQGNRIFIGNGAFGFSTGFSEGFTNDPT